MTKITTSTHYNGTVEIEFLENSHRYRIKGEKEYLIGVTTATGMLDKSRVLMGWATRLAGDYLRTRIGEPIDEIMIALAESQYKIERDRTADVGTQAHKWVENDIKGIKQELPENESVLNAVLAYIKWKDEAKPKFIFSEKRVYSKKYGYVGTMDCAFTLAKEDHEIIHAADVKTASGFYPDQAWQVAAYQEAEREEFGTVYGSKYILRFDRDTGEFETREYGYEQQEEHFKAFLACLTLKQAEKSYNKLNK